MNISDEKLGAFLDQELSNQEMELVRDAIRNDAALTQRLAALASVEALLQRHASALDSRPMPDAVLAMLQRKEQAADAEATAAPDNVVQMSSWQARRQQARQWLSQHAALAAGIALVVGFTGGQLLNTGMAGGPAARMVAINMDASLNDALDTTLSGETLSIDNDTRMLSRFSFVDQQSQHCRQFIVENGSVGETVIASENIACHTGQGWEIVASVRTAGTHAGEYQTAGGSSLLDSALDAMMPGSALSLEEEIALIADQWQ
ncbi:anti-sigma factor family protein [Pseudohongiella sp.]|uniref:Zinc-finger domain-containing protein n=1 Tax=marine sediment metagenome TaxID=412755 RepID=A0A0F9YIG3_9ZZZZ|nr:hypothetical protein [Pseudohongiella sp.]HDZ07806.1 hypothetical protein [Pseudohongiella sp.]HEA62877.1 hypothetical protein [Pseudohongiella sp.]